MNIVKNPRSEPAMIAEALRNKRGGGGGLLHQLCSHLNPDKTLWFGEYPLKYLDFQVANVLSLMASQLL